MNYVTSPFIFKGLSALQFLKNHPASMKKNIKLQVKEQFGALQIFSFLIFLHLYKI